jgi:HSP20 family protein
MSNTLSGRPRDPFFAEFDNLVRATFGPSASTGLGRQTGFSPAAEMHRDGEDALIRLELPGVSTDDVTVEVKGRHLVISGSRRDQREEQGEPSGGRRFSEFRYGSFTRSFRLAPSVTAEAVSASYDAGVLTVRVAGAYAEAEGHRIEISTGAPELAEGAGESQEG